MKLILNVAASLYGLIGIASLVSFLLLISFGPRITRDMMGLRLLFWYCLPLLNATICLVVTYGLLTLRRWARIAVIGFNAFLLATITIGLIQSRLIETPSGPWTAAATAFVLVVGGFLIGVGLLCSTERVRQLMSN
ncbi:MAG: hypothetical protein HY294_07015 [Candidatus Rokubacteria bacterium]|nr:hypothetical protein [Candidatus Rokubacteria bacterium]MBI3825726.1 hypothetical protein [Candidatus Rokubacteria bacterium]